jgi:phospholipase C
LRAVEVNRRQVLAGLGASLGAAAIGCGDDGNQAPGDDVGDADAASGPPDATRIDATEETACTATSALTPAELLAGIDAMVVLCMENRSFDHYLGALRLVEGRTDIDGLTGVETNPAPGGAEPVPVHLLEDFTPADPPHEWDACHEQWNDGANDGFVIAHAGASQNDVMGYHVREHIPVLYALADAGAICQRWFCSLLGPTWPNRFYLHAATSRGQKSNFPELGLTTIWDRLADAGVDGTNYYHDVAWATGGYGKLGGLAGISRFFEDAEAGNLPPFSIIDPAFFGGGANDDHPDHDIRMGQALIGSVVAALGQSPQWNRCLFVLTYDEHGGFYDHVPPPAPADGAEPDEEFRRFGFRVPSLVIGPTVRRGCAIDTVYEHSSVVATATLRWGLEPLNARASAAADLSACIDPRLLDAPQPPPEVPPVEISRRALTARQARWRAEGRLSHRELSAAIDARGVPRALDRRGDTDAIVKSVLAWGERLGAVRIRD